MRRDVALAVLLALGAMPVLSAAPVPGVTVVRASQAPCIDGRVAPGEWDAAAAVSGFLKPGGASLASPATTVLLTFDERALYLAFRCDESEARRPLAFERAHDDDADEDDSVQVFLAPEDLAAAPGGTIAFGGYAGAWGNRYPEVQAYFGFTVNGVGAMTESRNDVRDWDAPWEAKVGREPGAWVAEIAIPFASLGVAVAPRQACWGLNLLRRRSPELSGWQNPAFGGYTPLPLGPVLLVEHGPVARLVSVLAPKPGLNELAVTVVNPGPAVAEVELRLAPGAAPAVVRQVSVPACGQQPLSVEYALSGHGILTAGFEVRAKGTDTPLLSGLVPLAVPEPVQVSLRYYAVPAVVEGTVHLAEGATATRAVLSLQPAAGPASRQAETELVTGSGSRLRLPVEGQPGERFRARLDAVDAGGATVATRTIELTIPTRPAWLGARSDSTPGVLPPWTTMRVSRRTVEMLDKRLRFGELALPNSIRAAGAELLAQPIRLQVVTGGREVKWRTQELRVSERTADHVTVESVAHSEALDLRVVSTIEYDGFCWNQVTLTPHGRVVVDRLALDIPLRPAAARYVYQGHAQACGSLSPKGLRRPLSPNLWVGDAARGLAFLAESFDWVRSQDPARQVEILPAPGVTLWRSTFIDAPTELTTPYQAEFALHVTPAKPVTLRKSRIYHGAYYGIETARAGGTIEFPVLDHWDYAQGTLECWVKPSFDPAEVYDETADRSRYNRMFLDVAAATGGAGEVLILYYNADDRSLRVVKRDAAGQYPVVLGSPARLHPAEWSYVGLSWGERLRLNVNGTVVECQAKGSIAGAPGQGRVHITLADFALDELRVSRQPRPLVGVPSGPLTADDQTAFLHDFEVLAQPQRTAAGPNPFSLIGCQGGPGRFGNAVASEEESALDRLARDGQRSVIFHENWSRFQGYPDLEQVPKLRALADACHARGLLFLVYFCQLMSDAAPEWPGLANDFMALPERMWYHRDDVKQDCYVSCVNGPYGDLLLAGIARLADEAGIDGVYMDGTTVPWDCANPTHPGCGQYRGDGTYGAHWPVRGAREFMKRLRAIFATRRQAFFLDAHTGGAIHIGTQSFCDGYYDGETLARYKPGFRLSPDVFLTGYMGKPFGFRGEFLPNRHTMDQALAISLVHDTATRGQPTAVDLAWRGYEDEQTQFIPYWDSAKWFEVETTGVLASLYLKRDRALLAVGNQRDQAADCRLGLARVLRLLPRAVRARDAVTGGALDLERGRLRFELPARGWRLVELSVP